MTAVVIAQRLGGRADSVAVAVWAQALGSRSVWVAGCWEAHYLAVRWAVMMAEAVAVEAAVAVAVAAVVEPAV